MSCSDSDMMEHVPKIGPAGGFFQNAAATHLSLKWLGYAFNEDDDDAAQVWKCQQAAM